MSDHHPSPATKAEGSAEPRSLRIEDWLTVIIMALLALITFANVLVRYFTDASFAWTEEISIFLMIVLALVAGSAAVARDQHIRIEFFTSRGSAARKRRWRAWALPVLLCFLPSSLCSAPAWSGMNGAMKKPRPVSACRSGGIPSGCQFARWPSRCVPSACSSARASARMKT